LTPRTCICNNIPVSTKLKPVDLEDMVSECLMNRARLLSRHLTAIYEDELRTLGLRGSQLNVLAAIAYVGPVRRSDLAKAMHIDISTLTRNLRVMETNDWIAPVADRSDGRGAPIRITKAGQDLLARAMPLWRTAQRRTSELLGSEGRAALVSLNSCICSKMIRTRTE
jgi:DNA-binding MarR family transcriptional regulator